VARTLPASSRQRAEFPHQDDPEWVELTQEQIVAAESAARAGFSAFGPGQAAQDFARDFPQFAGFVGQQPAGFPSPAAWAGMSPHLQEALFANLNQGPRPRTRGVNESPQDFGGGFYTEVPTRQFPPFAPGPDETFTLGGEESHSRKLEAANGYADTLAARLHADANERKRKLGLFRDVVAGGLHWALEKIEGKPEALPSEPMGPIEQSWGRGAVNGKRAGVMKDLREHLGSFVRQSTGAVGELLVGVPGEEF
jgi:hypothetical protein